MRSTVRPQAGGRSGRAALALGLAFLLLQLALVIQARFVEYRHFCWAPHTTQVRYSMQVEVEGRTLSAREAGARYGLAHDYGWEAHSVENLKQLVEQYERTYAGDQPARVRMEYSVNGKTPEVWRWPSEGRR